ncbi:Hpt domain-containing protein [Chelativorans sp. Marseille-P2723]|uniref:Hpt domain-containing protein n=1 Tax=Chelativorans sp. Marseille-P2723 TaxID=2709133 RepID=UPI00157159F4|nr:Hpt domain-containing protein [Chelativorans sp. Marseille-P2723]
MTEHWKRRREAKGAPVIDLAHLASQTSGDPRLERDVLTLFTKEMTEARAALANKNTDVREKRDLAHRLVGSASAVGAFSLAATAAELEASPDSPVASASVVSELCRLVEAVAELLAQPAPETRG